MAKKEPKELTDDEPLFPELDKDKPEEKKLIKLLRDWADAADAHAEGMAGLHKEMVDTQDAAKTKMAELGHDAVKLDGYIFKRKPGPEVLSRTKAKVPKASKKPKDD